MKKTHFLLILSLILFTGCKSISDVKGSIDNSYKLELGIIAEDKVDNFINEFTYRYSFEIARDDNISNISGFYKDTYWRTRLPFDDEASLGFEDIYNKVIIKGSVIRNRTSTLSLNQVYYEIDIEILQEGKRRFTGEVIPFDFTEEGKEFTVNLARNLRDIVEAKIIQ